jgi:hypothetical protein
MFVDLIWIVRENVEDTKGLIKRLKTTDNACHCLSSSIYDTFGHCACIVCRLQFTTLLDIVHALSVVFNLRHFWTLCMHCLSSSYFSQSKSTSTVYNPSENFKWHNSFEDHQGNISTKFLSTCDRVTQCHENLITKNVYDKYGLWSV